EGQEVVITATSSDIGSNLYVYLVRYPEASTTASAGASGPPETVRIPTNGSFTLPATTTYFIELDSVGTGADQLTLQSVGGPTPTTTTTTTTTSTSTSSPTTSSTSTSKPPTTTSTSTTSSTSSTSTSSSTTSTTKSTTTSTSSSTTTSTTKST